MTAFCWLILDLKIQFVTTLTWRCASERTPPVCIELLRVSYHLLIYPIKLHSPKKETPRLFNLNLKKKWRGTIFGGCSSLFQRTPLLACTPSGNFIICKLKCEEFLFLKSVDYKAVQLPPLVEEPKGLITHTSTYCCFVNALIFYSALTSSVKIWLFNQRIHSEL